MLRFSFQMPLTFHSKIISRQEAQYGPANQPTPPGLVSLLTPPGLRSQTNQAGQGNHTNQHGLVSLVSLDSLDSLQLLGGLDLHHKPALMVLLAKLQEH